MNITDISKSRKGPYVSPCVGNIVVGMELNFLGTTGTTDTYSSQSIWGLGGDNEENEI